MNFSGVWFPDEGSESARARGSNQMSFNTRYNVVTHIIFYIFDYLRVRIGDRKSSIKKCSILRHLFSHET